MSYDPTSLEGVPAKDAILVDGNPVAAPRPAARAEWLVLNKPLAVDLSERAEVARLLGEAGDVDILVANAALPGSGRVEDYSVGEVDRVLDVNLRAPIVLAQGLLPR